MYKVVHELVYLPQDIFVPKFTTSLLESTFNPLLIQMHSYTRLYLAKARSAWSFYALGRYYYY